MHVNRMKNLDYYNRLDPQMQALFKECFCAQKPKEEFVYFLDLRFENTFDFYVTAFKWSETPQGHEFWADIADADGSFRRRFIRLTILKAVVTILGLLTVARIAYHILAQ